MKRLSTLLLTMVATAASAAIYPSSDWFGTNVQKQTTAAGVRAALGITSTGGSATNVYFTSGQSTTPRTVSGSNTFDVTGTLTNYTRNYSAGISNNAADSVNVVFQSANRLVFNDPTGGEQAHYVWGRAGTSLGSQDSFWWNPDLNFSWLSFLSHPFMGVGFNDDNVLIEWNYDESNAITNHIYGTNTSITIDGRYRGAGLSLTSTETNSSLTGGVLAADANGRRKIAALSGLAWDGTTLTASGDGSGLTNVPSKFVASINALTNLPVQSNLIVYVESYFGTNSRGGGKFIWENSSATVDYGYVFYGASGRWRRIDTGYDTNVFFMENYGVVPNAAVDSYTAAQAAIDATPTAEGKTILPPYNFAIGQTLWFTNRRGSYLGTLEIGKVRSSGYRVFPNPTCVIHWMGVNGGTNMVAYDSGHNTFAGFGLDTRIGLNNGDQWTNAAGLLMDVDMNPTHSTTTSANVFDGIYFRERGTNTALVGQRIASYNWQNCEFFRWYDCYWQGGGWNLPQYWVQTTNLGAFKAVQLGGNGGGQNSFQHYMFNCGWDRWMYDIHSTGGNWEIDSCKSTAAGAAAFYLNGDHPSIIRFADCEGDRQFLISPGDTVQLVGNRIADAVQAGYTNLPPIDAVKLLAYGNYLQHEAYIPSLTNSFNSTGSYDGAGNSFDTTNDALIASWRFNSAFNSRGDFGTLKDHNNIQSGPWKTPSALQGTNIVYQTLTDSATFPVMTLMSSNGGVAIGGYINNVVASLWNKDYATRVHFQIGDPYRTDRFNLTSPSSGARTMAQLKSDDASYLQLSTTNTRVDFNTGFGRNSIVFVQNYGEIVGTNNQQLVYFGTDYKIKFPYDTNFEVVGPVYLNQLSATNHINFFTNDSLSSLPATPLRYGQVTLVDSNASLLAATASTSGSLAWAGTNLIPTTASQIVRKFTGTPNGSLFLRDDGTLSAIGGSQVTLSGTDGALLYNNAGGIDFADWSVFNSQGGTLTTNNNTLLGGSFVLTGDGGRGLTNLAIGAGLAVENGVLKTNGQTTGGGSSDTYGFGTNTAAASSWTNSGNHNFTGIVQVNVLQAGALTTTLGGSATIWDHSTFAGASAGQEIWDAFAVAGNKVFGAQFQPNDVQQPTNILFRVDYPTKNKQGIGSFATNYIANANSAGYTNSRVAPGIGGTNNMVARVVGTSGTLEFYNRSGEYGATICGVGVFTNTISSSTWHIPIPVNSGFIIRSGSGVDIQVYAQ